MSITGQLSRDRFGYSMPVDAPLYEPFPLYYEDARILLFPYLTDAAKAAALVPPPLEVVTVDPQNYARARREWSSRSTPSATSARTTKWHRRSRSPTRARRAPMPSASM